ncbi:MAG: HEPN domain-containing protein [bacterium]|nr:HEPN domain-containing protein [bacterium]
MEEKTKEKVTKLIEKAERKLKAAHKLYESEMYEDAISRGYYAMYHAATALLLTKDLTAKTHSGLLTMLSLHFVKSGAMEEEYYSMIARDKDLRENGDYEPFYIGSSDEAECVIEDAQKFIKKVKGMI